MKRVATWVLLIALVLCELYFLTALLPMGWQRAIDLRIPHDSRQTHEWTSATHPLLSQEIEQVLREHFWLRFFLDAIALTLLIINTQLIVRLWRLLRTVNGPSQQA